MRFPENAIDIAVARLLGDARSAARGINEFEAMLVMPMKKDRTSKTISE